jgi:6-phosphogluconolactonase
MTTNLRFVHWIIGVAATVLLLAAGVGDVLARGGWHVANTNAIRVWVGTYTNSESRGIYTLEFDAASGKWLSQPVLAAATENPSFLALHPSGRFLYAVNELTVFQGQPTGAVSAFKADAASGRLEFLNRQPSQGKDPCHLIVDEKGRNLLVANYTSGTVAVLPVSADGRLSPATDVQRGNGSGPVRDRQEGPHAHMVALDRTERFALWADLGADRLHVDRFDPAHGRLEPAIPDGVAIEPGSGPRHLAWHPSGRALYVLNELSASVSTLRFEAAGTLETLQTVATRAAGATIENTAAEIVVAPGGRFLYTSNRGDDSIVAFAIDRDSFRLTRIGQVSSGGRTPRHFAIDPSGRWMIVANQASGSLVVFRLDQASGLPAAVGSAASVPEPVCVLFARPM